MALLQKYLEIYTEKNTVLHLQINHLDVIQICLNEDQGLLSIFLPNVCRTVPINVQQLPISLHKHQ